MCVQSQFRQVLRLYGDLEKDRGQSHSTQSYNGLLSSYFQERSAAIDWMAGSSRVVHISFHRPVKNIFFITLRGAKRAGWKEKYDQAFDAIKQYLIEPPILDSPLGKRYTLPLLGDVKGLIKSSFVQRRRKLKAETNILREQISI